MVEKGLVQIYTGNGKGKTTASLGLAIRAAGRGNKVLIYQFLKPAKLELGERKAIEMAGLNIKIETLDIKWNMLTGFTDEKAVSMACDAIHQELKRLSEIAAKRVYDVIILDELVFCINKKLAAFDEVAALLKGRDSRVEIVMTGRGASDALIELADLVTEMREIKHPFNTGIDAREGIEY